MLMDNEVTKFQDPTVVTVDSYQGEENDMVILSLFAAKKDRQTVLASLPSITEYASLFLGQDADFISSVTRGIWPLRASCGDKSSPL